MEEKQLFFSSTPELWVEKRRNKRALQGKRKYQAAQEGKKTNAGKIKLNDQNL